MDLYYGFLVGMAYTLPNSIAGLYAGALTKTGNRKAMMLMVITALSLCSLLTGTIDSFELLVVLRILHGSLSSAVNPLGYSLLAETVPKETKNFAYSIFQAANYAGLSLSSLSILLVT
jgi:MFS family permease